MTGLQTLAERLILGAAAGAAGVVLSSARAIHRPGNSAFRRIAAAAFLLSRFGSFVLIFLVFHVAPRGDIPGFYFPEGSAALRGLLPYRDFASSYAPLHPFMDGALLFLWHSPLVIILFAICVEGVLFRLWLRVGSDLFPEPLLRKAAVLYLTSALSLQFVTIDGQDNVVIALLVLLALWLAMRSKDLASGALTALGVVIVKLIPLFYAPVFFAGRKRRWAWAAGFFALLAVGYGSFVAAHLHVLQPLEIEGPLKSSGTLPYLIETATGLNLPVIFWNAIMLIALGLVYLAVWRQSSGGASPGSPLSILWGVTAVTLVLLAFANKSWSPYLMLSLFPLCVIIGMRGLGTRITFAAFSIVALAEKSYWATLLNEESAPQLRSAVLHHNLLHIGFLPIQVLLLLGYAWLLKLCAERLLHPPNQPPDEPSDKLAAAVPAAGIRP